MSPCLSAMATGSLRLGHCHCKGMDVTAWMSRIRILHLGGFNLWFASMPPTASELGRSVSLISQASQQPLCNPLQSGESAVQVAQHVAARLAQCYLGNLWSPQSSITSATGIYSYTDSGRQITGASGES